MQMQLKILIALCDYVTIYLILYLILIYDMSNGNAQHLMLIASFSRSVKSNRHAHFSDHLHLLDALFEHCNDRSSRVVRYLQP